MLLSLFLAPCFTPLASAAPEPARPTEQVTADLAAFYETFAGRPLSADEQSQVTTEFIAYYGAETCGAGCAKTLDNLKARAALMQSHAGQPDDLAIRHALLSVNYFDPKIAGSLQLRLLSERDPVRVVDTKTKRLMTEKDVVAAINLHVFRNAKGEPKPVPVPETAIEDLAAKLNSAFGGAGKEKLPLFFVFAAEFWTGIQRQWPAMPETDRKAALNYIQYMSARPMPVPLYQKLMGLNADDARQVEAIDQGVQMADDVRQQPIALYGPARRQGRPRRDQPAASDPAALARDPVAARRRRAAVQPPAKTCPARSALPRTCGSYPRADRRSD